MDISSIAGSALLMRTEQTQQTLSVSMMKQAADMQSKMVNMLAQSAQQAAQPVANGDGRFGFSTYA